MNYERKNILRIAGAARHSGPWFSRPSTVRGSIRHLTAAGKNQFFRLATSQRTKLTTLAAVAFHATLGQIQSVFRTLR